MQRTVIILACFFVCVNCFSQQYPFVHYTPKDGLVSNRVRSIYQDSKGRMYFLSMNGLSVYDGSRFTNYTSEDGLENDIVNCIMEMADDSMWVATNTNRLNCLVKGKLKPLTLNNISHPVINYLCRDENRGLYAAADDGLFMFQQDSFSKLPFTDMLGKDINSYIANLLSVGNYLLCLRDPGLGGAYILYLYDCRQKKIVSQTDNIKVTNMAQSNDGRIWISTGNGIKQLDKAQLIKGKIVLHELPVVFKTLSDKIGSIFFDSDNNCWVVEGSRSLIKCDKNGNSVVYTTSSGLNTIAISFIFQDKEGITWFASNGGGVDKLMHTNFSVLEKPFGLSWPADLFLSPSKKETLLYSYKDKKLVRFSDYNSAEIFPVTDADEIGQLLETYNGVYGIGPKKVFRLRKKNSSWLPELIFTDTTPLKNFGIAAIDPAGTIIITGHSYLTAVQGETISQTPVTYLADQLAFDNKGNMWLANRLDELIRYSTHPKNPTAYLKQEMSYKKEISDLAPRSIVIDNNHNIWIGTRYKGVFVFKNENEKLILLYHLTSRTGLSENFVSYLACDEDNMVWACTPSGLDKISIKNGSPVVENLTLQNNIYQGIIRVVIDKNKTAWALFTSGLIKITTENHPASAYIPKLMFTQIRTGADTLNEADAASFSYKQNNLSFQFSAPSFMDEKQILYSYQLQGSTTNEWTSPSNNAVASFIDLRPGKYALNIKAKFPAGRYPDQLLQYKFSISPPWWQTWWFRVSAGLLSAGLFIIAFRFYYHRKLERQQMILEKQQAIDQERSRIAADMHDDLGAGLTKIKYITEHILEKTDSGEAVQFELQKLKSFSSELVESMGEIIWAASEKDNLLSNTLYYLRSYAVNYCEENDLDCQFEIPGSFKDRIVGGNIRRSIFLLLKEGLHNVVKHAGAKKVTIKIGVTEKLELIINDDGKGISENENISSGNGLINMKKRVLELNGSIEFKNVNGTSIIIHLPFTPNQSTID
jgi:ligand-binding sensor domain-containing protein